MVIEIDRSKWELPQNKLSQRNHSAEKQHVIRTQVEALLKVGVIEESRATYWKVLRWKLYLQDKDFHLCHVPGKEVHQGVPDALSRLCENHMPAKQEPKKKQGIIATLSALHWEST